MENYPWDKRKDKFPRKPEGFEDEIRRLDDEMMNALREGKPFSYGFTIVSVNGQPAGEIPLPQPKKEEPAEREPLIDIINGDGETKILIDLPGVDKKDIDLTAEDNTLEVKVETKDRKYQKKIKLPHDIGDAKTEYKNGVLEVRIKNE